MLPCWGCVMDIEELKRLAFEYKSRPDLQVNEVAFRNAANPAAVLELISEVESLRNEVKTEQALSFRSQVASIEQQRDGLLAALREIAGWTERYTTPGHPISTVARAAIANAEKQS